MNVLDLFSGVGGFSLGLERAGMRTVGFCEIDPYCRAVLKKHWPSVPCYDDVRTLTVERLRADGIIPDVICGGFPCQDASVAQTGGHGAPMAEPWVKRKHGMFYRPDNSGYTTDICEAGFYAREDAEASVQHQPGVVTAAPVTAYHKDAVRAVELSVAKLNKLDAAIAAWRGK